MTACTKCKTEKSADDFPRDRRKRNGRSSWCRLCHKARNAQWRDDNRQSLTASQRSSHLRHRYGLDRSAVDEMFAAQDGKCAICAESMIVTHVDHCHATGAVRSLLCPGCNLGLGHFTDNPEVLRRAAEYVERHAQ